jgi:hypothetical protein
VVTIYKELKKYNKGVALKYELMKLPGAKKASFRSVLYIPSRFKGFVVSEIKKGVDRVLTMLCVMSVCVQSGAVGGGIVPFHISVCRDDDELMPKESIISIIQYVWDNGLRLVADERWSGGSVGLGDIVFACFISCDPELQGRRGVKSKLSLSNQYTATHASVPKGFVSVEPAHNKTTKVEDWLKKHPLENTHPCRRCSNVVCNCPPCKCNCFGVCKHNAMCKLCDKHAGDHKLTVKRKRVCLACFTKHKHKCKATRVAEQKAIVDKEKRKAYTKKLVDERKKQKELGTRERQRVALCLRNATKP